MVTVQNDDKLNFEDGLTISYMMKVEQYYDRESYPVSHGNWSSRWKTSLNDERLRFTINGSDGIIDVDSETKFETDVWYHIVALYNGGDCLIYVDGELDGFKPFSGTINNSAYDLVFGQSLPDQEGFNYNGVIDKLRIYNYGLSHEEVQELVMGDISSIEDYHSSIKKLKLFPNPATDIIQFSAFAQANEEIDIVITSITGKVVYQNICQAGNNGFLNGKINISTLPSGAYLITLKDSLSSTTRLFVHN